MTGHFDDVLARVTKKSARAVRMDGPDGDPEMAHGCQDKAAKAALGWIAQNSSCARSAALAEIALRPFETDGARWFA